jgi:hypothetical protein
MKHALIEGRRREAETGLVGTCPICGSLTIAKCGERRIWHWAHRGERRCDQWWEPETSWHREWKNRFPTEWQEVVHRADNGERHIADVKTPHGRIIEFQHSYLKPDERRTREAFYKSIIWVVNGLRLKRSKHSFYRLLTERVPPNVPQSQFSIMTHECEPLRAWGNSGVGVYLDFGETEEDVRRFGIRVLWRLSPTNPDGFAVLNAVSITAFIEALLSGTSIKGIPPLLAPRVRLPPIPLPGFARYLARGRRMRRRF